MAPRDPVATPHVIDSDDIVTNESTKTAQKPSPSLNPRMWWDKTKHAFQHAELDSFKVVILVIYFVQGAGRLPRMAWTYFLKEDLHQDPSVAQSIQGDQTVPWTLKPAYGLVSDLMPIMGFRRKPYLLLAGLIGMAAWVCMGTFVDTAQGVSLGVVFAAASIAIGDVMADSLVVEHTQNKSQEEIASFQSLCWGARAVGAIICACISGYLLNVSGPRMVFMFTVIFPAIIATCAFMLKEQKVEDSFSFHRLKDILNSAYTHIKDEKLILPIIFLYLTSTTPSTQQVMYYWYEDVLGFKDDKSLLGWNSGVTECIKLLGVIIFQKYFKSVSLRHYFFWISIAKAAVASSTLIFIFRLNTSVGIPDSVYFFFDTIINTMLGTLSWMPIVVIAASICPPKIEGTFFALLMSVTNMGELTGEKSGAKLLEVFGFVCESTADGEPCVRDYDNLYILHLITVAFYLSPALYCLWLVPTRLHGGNSSSNDANEQLLGVEMVASDEKTSSDLQQGTIAQV